MLKSEVQPLNPLAPMLASPFINIICVRPVQFLNAESLMAVYVPGIVTVSRAVVPEKKLVARVVVLFG